MPSRLSIAVVLTCALPLLLTSQADAGQLEGTWRAQKSGTLFHVSPPVPSTVANATAKPKLAGAHIALRQPKSGKLNIYVTRWVKGMRGAQFRFGRATATLSPDGNRVRFSSGTVWERVRHHRGGGAPAGFWQSSSGSVFMVTAPSGGGFFVANLKGNTARAFVARAAWIKGMRGRQFKYGGRSTATLAPGGQTMRVVGTKANTWTRIGSWGSAPRRVVRAPRATMAGRWASKRSGVMLEIPRNAGRMFDVIWQSPDGRTLRKLHANWTRGLRGTQLQFNKRGERITCTWSDRNPNRLTVMGWGGRTRTFVRAR